jgi:transposase
LFVGTDFFDPYDLLQVKYEVVRRVRVDRQRVSETARDFGFSRPTVYQALSAFERGGLAALLPQKPGPRRAHKLSVEVVDYLERSLADEPDLTADELVVALRERFGLSVHPRSIGRALRRREKKRR